MLLSVIQGCFFLLQHALRKAPKTIQEIKALIHERLQIRADIKLVSTSDQQELVSNSILVFLSISTAPWFVKVLLNNLT